MAKRPALPSPGRAAPSPAEADRNEPSGAERSRIGPSGPEPERNRSGSEGIGGTRSAPPCTDPPGAPVTTGDASPATPKFAPPPPEATGRDIIPVYCSLLAAVVVGLLAYVAFKCWHTCRQKQQLAKARAGDMGTSPDGEKLQSDSGVFLDTPGLQEPHPPGKAPHPQGHPLGAVSPQRQEELERLLESGGTRGHQLHPVTTGPQGSDVTSAV
ncbi:death domain-containing membrane protein NRADD-like [Columba livia]|uniref:death domain-containing membrane protein NRADD-like n=1 Tax=Columba livia TaxID=8932 RepID=UPI0031B9B314